MTPDQSQQLLSSKYKLHGRQLFISILDPTRTINDQFVGESSEEPGKVYLRDLPAASTEEELASFLTATYGPLLYCYLVNKS